jgi:hypothetical protein
MSGRDPKFCRPMILQTRATEVLKTHTTFTQLNVDPNTLPSSTNWETHTDAKSKARNDRQNAIDALDMKIIIDQKAHGIPTSTELDGFEAGTVREEVEPSNAFWQLCTALSRDCTLNTKAELVEWSKDQPEYSELHEALKRGQWPE